MLGNVVKCGLSCLIYRDYKNTSCTERVMASESLDKNSGPIRARLFILRTLTGWPNHSPIRIKTGQVCLCANFIYHIKLTIALFGSTFALSYFHSVTFRCSWTPLYVFRGAKSLSFPCALSVTRTPVAPITPAATFVILQRKKSQSLNKTNKRDVLQVRRSILV